MAKEGHGRRIEDLEERKVHLHTLEFMGTNEIMPLGQRYGLKRLKNVSNWMSVSFNRNLDLIDRRFFPCSQKGDTFPRLQTHLSNPTIQPARLVAQLPRTKRHVSRSGPIATGKLSLADLRDDADSAGDWDETGKKTTHCKGCKGEISRTDRCFLHLISCSEVCFVQVKRENGQLASIEVCPGGCLCVRIMQAVGCAKYWGRDHICITKDRNPLQSALIHPDLVALHSEWPLPEGYRSRAQEDVFVPKKMCFCCWGPLGEGYIYWEAGYCSEKCLMRMLESQERIWDAPRCRLCSRLLHRKVPHQGTFSECRIFSDKCTLERVDGAECAIDYGITGERQKRRRKKSWKDSLESEESTDKDGSSEHENEEDEKGGKRAPKRVRRSE